MWVSLKGAVTQDAVLERGNILGCQSYLFLQGLWGGGLLRPTGVVDHSLCLLKIRRLTTGLPQELGGHHGRQRGNILECQSYLFL